MRHFSVALASLCLLGAKNFAKAQDDDDYEEKGTGYLVIGGEEPDEIEYEVYQEVYTGSFSIEQDFEVAYLDYKVFVVGGMVADFMVLDLETDVVAAATITGDSMSARIGHSMAATEEKFYVFGGTSDGNTELNDFYELDPETYALTEITVADVPSARIYSSMANWPQGDSVIVFGGNDGSSDLNDVYEFDAFHQTWTAYTTTGPAPSARQGARTLVFQDKLYVLGGLNVADTELHTLDLETKEWGPVTLDESLPQFTSFDMVAGMIISEDESLPVIYIADGNEVGKVYEVDLTLNSWKIVSEHDGVNSADFARAVQVDDSEFLVFHGTSGSPIFINEVEIYGEFYEDDEDDDYEGGFLTSPVGLALMGTTVAIAVSAAVYYFVINPF